MALCTARNLKNRRTLYGTHAARGPRRIAGVRHGRKGPPPAAQPHRGCHVLTR